MTADAYESVTVGVDEQRGAAWRRLARWGAIGTIVVVVVVTVLSRQLIPPLVIGGVLLAGGLWWVRRPGKGGVIFVGVVSLLLFLLNLPFAVPALAHPDSAWDFVLVGLMMVSLLVSIIGMVGALRATSPGDVPARRVGLGAAALAVLVVIVGLVAGLTAKNDEAQPGDLAIRAKLLKWEPASLQAKAGPIAVVVDNEDQTRHDFTIKNVVSADLTAAKVRRVEFTAAAGTYEFICTLHPEMKGTLTVS